MLTREDGQCAGFVSEDRPIGPRAHLPFGDVPTSEIVNPRPRRNRPLDSEGGIEQAWSQAVSSIRVVLFGEVLFHREALARALAGYEDVALVGSVADVHAALFLAEETRANVLLIDSPSEAAAQAVVAHPREYKVVFIGAAGECRRQLGGRDDAIFLNATSSLDDVHVALRFAMPRLPAPRSPPSQPPGIAGDLESILAMRALLTPREREVSRLVAQGFSNKEIASAFGLSLATVKNHVHRILGKLKLQRRSQVARPDGAPATIQRQPAPPALLVSGKKEFQHRS